MFQDQRVQRRAHRARPLAELRAVQQAFAGRFDEQRRAAGLQHVAAHIGPKGGNGYCEGCRIGGGGLGHVVSSLVLRSKAGSVPVGRVDVVQLAPHRRPFAVAADGYAAEGLAAGFQRCR
ncbi:hypothetical protein D3C87_1876630 [compost metagenome]